MKLIVVKCPKNKKVQVEDRGTGGAACPDNCPLKMKSRCFNNTFRYTKPLSDLVAPDIPYEATGSTPVQEPTPIKKANDQPTVLNTAPTTQKGAATVSEAPKSSENSFSPAPTTNKLPVFEDLFADDDGSTIEYSPFGSFDAGQTDYSYSQPTVQEPKRTLDKYNDALMTGNSIFSVVKSRGDNEPCFVDGAYKFYDRAPAGVRSDGNSQTAVMYVFKHWYVSRVFTDDGSAYREEFLYLLKQCGFKNSEDKLKHIVDDIKLSKDKKFFRLFYTVIFKNQISSFYWSDGDSPFKQITPRLVSIDDFYRKLSESYDPSDFMSSFRNCFDELVYFLRSFSEMENSLEWFKEKIPQIIAERCNRLVYVSDENGEISIINLGNAREFVSKMAVPSDFDTMELMSKFLEEFEITSGYKLLPRKTKLKTWVASNTEDDRAYEILGITGYTSSQCATAYDNYLTILAEYMRVFKPEKLTIGNLSFSMRNFYYEILTVFKNAGAFLKTPHPENYREVKIFYVVKSLFERGIFEIYERSCETIKLSRLKKVFEAPAVTIKDYFDCKEIDHELYVDGYFITVSEYIERIVSKNAGFIMGTMNDEIMNAYISSNIKETDGNFVSAEREINRMLKEQKELIGKLKK